MMKNHSEIPEIIKNIAFTLAQCESVEGCLLGGSRASGTSNNSSDYDIGLYYNSEFDSQEIKLKVCDLLGHDFVFSRPYEWGKRVNGGAWLNYQGLNIDLIYRNMDDIKISLHNATDGKIIYHYQLGHPFGAPDYAYVGELALGIPLYCSKEFKLLKNQAEIYPEKLAKAVVFHGLFDAQFYTELAIKAIKIPDMLYISGCVFAISQLLALSIHGYNRKWVINEKRAVIAVENLTTTVPNLQNRLINALPQENDTCDALAYKLDTVKQIIEETMNILDYNDPRRINF